MLNAKPILLLMAGAALGMAWTIACNGSSIPPLQAQPDSAEPVVCGACECGDQQASRVVVELLYADLDGDGIVSITADPDLCSGLNGQVRPECCPAGFSLVGTMYRDTGAHHVVCLEDR